MTGTCLIDSRYRLMEAIGLGGMGEVFRAYDERCRREVAVKLIAERLATDELAVRRFKREAAVCARLRHPNIVTGLGSGYDERSDRHFIVMELVDGEDLAALATQRGPLPVAEVTAIVAQVCDALAYAHAQGVVHGDVSPGNILISRDDGTVKLTDFGLSRPRATGPSTRGRPAGTPRYLAPEVEAGYAATPLSDLWSLGAVAHRLIAGETSGADCTTVPGPGTSRLQPLGHLRPHVPVPIAHAVDVALRTEPSERHPSPQAFRNELVASRHLRAA
jgi:serine/threonine protein kinase